MKNQHPIFTHPTVLLIQKCNKTLDNLKQIHSHMITTALIHHTYPVSRLLLFCSALSIPYTLTLFNEIPNPSIFLYNTLISSFSNTTQHTHIAFSLYSKLLSDKSLTPNNFTYPSLLKACKNYPWLHFGRPLHTHVFKFLHPTCDHFVRSSLLNFYSKCGDLNSARYLFDQIPEPDLVTWNSILTAYAKNTTSGYAYRNSDIDEYTSLSLEALVLFTEMQMSLTRPNEVSLVALIGACADLGAFSQGIWAHAYVIKNKLNMNRFIGTVLIEMYAKCGCLDLANQCFDDTFEKDTLCYNAMIGGFAIHGCGQEALALLCRMRNEGVRCDEVTMLVVMCACAHGGLVEKGREIFNIMEVEYGIEPKLEHYSCLVDLLGRAGKLKEAEEVLKTMPMKPNAMLWRSLLGACRVHGDLELGELSLEHLIQLEPETSGNYVLLSNLYARTDRWDDARRVRELMRSHGVDKSPGLSLIEIGGVIHEFVMGDNRHPSSKEIYLKLEEINSRLQTYGHKPRTKEVLFDIEQEEKEDALSCHSERLAIAFGLVQTNSHAPIRIIKNLRVCIDCHESTKIISMLYGREIIVRDRNRFHHFKWGRCSCMDYW